MRMHVHTYTHGKSQTIVGKWKNTAGEALLHSCLCTTSGLGAVQTQLVFSEPSASSGDIFSTPGDGGHEH